MNVIVSADVDALTSETANRLSGRIRDLQAKDRTPRVLLTGGSVAMATYRKIEAAAADWAHVEFWMGDERYVPAGNSDRNDHQAQEAFLDRVGAEPELVHVVEDNDCSISAADAAKRYAAVLPAEQFDVALFGVGPDGHIASLFPGFPQLDEDEADVVAVFDSPKPPPVRLTMTFPRLNRSTAVWFLVSGADKAEVVARALAKDGDIHDTPARGVRGSEETLWLLDEAAASKL
jgi:6-phosphogluconolactonase